MSGFSRAQAAYDSAEPDDREACPVCDWIPCTCESDEDPDQDRE